MRKFRSGFALLVFLLSSCTSLNGDRQNADYFSKDEFPKLKSDFNLISTEDRGRRLMGYKTSPDFILVTFLQFKNFPVSDQEKNWLRGINQLHGDSKFSNISFQYVDLNEVQNREALIQLQKELNLRQAFLSDPTQISALDSQAKFHFDSVLFFKKTKSIIGHLNISNGEKEFSEK
ncbi:MAG: hypothetical protein K0R29_2675, partial [Pseudobdellovibrio sp.]|nr:hypothetical protein [Pseudobdellovibrio sp.]